MTLRNVLALIVVGMAAFGFMFGIGVFGDTVPAFSFGLLAMAYAALLWAHRHELTKGGRY